MSELKPFQERVQSWIQVCFGPKISSDRLERNDRFIEEALELVQACEYPKARALALVDYVFNRPVGYAPQEVGGVMVTLAALCLAHGMDMSLSGEIELARISEPAIVEKIRRKQAAKPTGSALPVADAPRAVEQELVEALKDAREALADYACHFGVNVPCHRTGDQSETECGWVAGDALVRIDAVLARAKGE